MTGLTQLELEAIDPEVEKRRLREEREAEPETIAERRNRELTGRRVERYPELRDFYNEYDELEVTPAEQEKFDTLIAELDANERALLDTGKVFTVIDFENIGGLVSPLILQIEYEDDSVEELRIPAEIWRRNPLRASKLLITDQPIRRVTQDPWLETADIDTTNNTFPPRPAKSRFQLFKEEKEKNPMQIGKPPDDTPDPEEGSGG